MYAEARPLCEECSLNALTKGLVHLAAMIANHKHALVKVPLEDSHAASFELKNRNHDDKTNRNRH